MVYVTSAQRALLGEADLDAFERHSGISLPQPYRTFLSTYGAGTYGGAVYVVPPDGDALKAFSDGAFWRYEDAPITQAQLRECAVIANSIDGDQIALHPAVRGYILLPRHSDTITLIPDTGGSFVDTLVRIGYALYQEQLADHFEPLGGRYVFLRSQSRDLCGVAERFKAVFGYDFLVEDPYTCQVFLAEMGGYVRFNLAYGFEAAVCYHDRGTAQFQKVKEFLAANGFRQPADPA